MSKVNIYLNFQGNTEEAFNFYKTVFKTDFAGPLVRMGDGPQQEGGPQIPEAELNKVMHVALPIIGGTLLMGTDMLESMGHKLVIGNNMTISLQLEENEQADNLYKALSEGGSENIAPHEEFWGYWGTCLDRFGIRWMFNVPAPEPNE